MAEPGRGAISVALSASSTSPPLSPAERRRGYREAMHRHGLATLADVLAGGPTEDDGATAARVCLDRAAPRPSAITVFNDRCATGVLDVLRRLAEEHHSRERFT